MSGRLNGNQRRKMRAKHRRWKQFKILVYEFTGNVVFYWDRHYKVGPVLGHVHNGILVGMDWAAWAHQSEVYEWLQSHIRYLASPLVDVVRHAMWMEGGA